MKAIGVNQYGGPEVLQVVELPTPHPTAGQVRVKVHTAGINPVDEMLRSGDLAAWYGDTPRPYIPGMDMAGTIDEIGADVDAALGLSVGQQVVGIVDNFGSYGAYSEYLCLPARSVMPVPAGASLPEAGSFLMNALTARNALDNLELPQGSTVLVTVAAGAVGAYAIALAKADGFTPIAVASPADEDFLRQQGAVAVIPRGEQLAERIRALYPEGVDAVYPQQIRQCPGPFHRSRNHCADWPAGNFWVTPLAGIGGFSGQRSGCRPSPAGQRRLTGPHRARL